VTTSQWPAQGAPDDPQRASAPAPSNLPPADGQPVTADGQSATTGNTAARQEPAADSVADPAVRGQPQPVWVQPSLAGQPIQSWAGTGWRPMLPSPYSPVPVPVPAPPTHKWGFGAFLLVEAVFLAVAFIVVLVLANLRLVESGAPPGAALVVSLAVPTVIAALTAIMITWWRGNGPIVDLRLKFGWRDVGIGVACGAVGVIVTIPAGWLWAVWVGEERAHSAVGEVFDGIRLSPWLAVLVFLIVWLLAPLCEEILYRGLLWGAMERRAWNRWVILVIATVVFAVAHGESWRTPLLLVIGLPMGVARMLSGRLPAAVIAHQVNNFLPALGLLLLLLGVPLTDG
jgi:uncharacterized protein